jgi:hypothetical protein
MVTLRRLLLEFGIVGDQAVKQKMKEIQLAASASKKTLKSLNEQIEILNRANLGNLNIPMSGTVLTTSEQQQARYISQQKEQKETAKLEIANEQIKVTKDLLGAINRQIDTQKQTMSKFFTQFEMEPAFEGAEVGRGAKGRFVSMKGAKVAQQIKEKFEETLPKQISKQDIEKTKAVVQNIVSTAPNITETKANIQNIASTSESKELDILQAEIDRLKRSGTQNIPLIKPFIPERESKTKFIENIKNVSESRLQGISSHILGKEGLQSMEEIKDPQTNIFNVLKQMENEKERKQKIKAINEIKGRLSKEQQLTESVREKGFAVRPVERARQMQEFIQEKTENFKEKIREKAIGFGKRIGLLESPEQFEKRRMVKFQQKAEEIVKKPEVQKIININFKDTTVDSKNREKLIVEKITQALRGV